MAKLVAPTVRLFLACEEAILDVDDDGDSKWILSRPLHTAALPNGAKDYIQEEMWFYAQLVSGVGKFKLSVALSSEDGYWVKRSDAYPLNCSQYDPLTVHEVVFRMTQVYFPHAGLYEFKLLANHAELPAGLAFFRILSESSKL